MFIVDKTRTMITNINCVSSIYLERNRIIAESQRESILLGNYLLDERAEKVFEELLKTVFPNRCFPNDGTISEKRTDGCYIYYMPEE